MSNTKNKQKIPCLEDLLDINVTNAGTNLLASTLNVGRQQTVCLLVVQSVEIPIALKMLWKL